MTAPRPERDPIVETAEDRARDRALLARLAHAWAAELRPTPPLHYADAEVIIGGKRRLWVEVKSLSLRIAPPATYPTIPLDVAKVEHLDALDVSSYFVVHAALEDRLYSIPLASVKIAPTEMFERKKPRASGLVCSTDRKLVHRIPAVWFKLIPEVDR